ncbi:aspartate/glutamate racemase family protein [Xanthomarina sp. GH4-25]|uniref:aspartate/glutamate racemase family protein n=1 Tax=Xanthomarina sp. GH4-25 TaxID=3349335 RepID=UPI003877C2E4
MSKNGNTLGILGLGNRSTLFYINTLNVEFNNIENTDSTYPFILLNTDFNTINPYLPNNFKKLIPSLSRYIHQIEKLPISHLLIPNITLHETLDKLSISIPILHPLELSIAKLKENNANRVVIFGSKYTMTSTYISNFFSSEGIEAISPTKDDIDFIDRLRQKIYSNSETLTDLDMYNSLLESYNKKASVLIACTEISIIKNSIPVLDMVKLQINAALKLCKKIK